jgi:Tfp pilus assembly protein PilF
MVRSAVPTSDGRHRRLTTWIVPLFIALGTFVTFLPALSNGFVIWDDDKNFLSNPQYRGLGVSQLHWMWTTFHLGHYVPLSWMTLGLDYELWGMNPRGYHLTNLLLHCADAVLLYFVARRILRLAAGATTDGGLIAAAAFAALLFAVHPLRVESVAWVTERRDVLSLCFYLSSLLAYLRSSDAEASRRRWYLASLGLFLCALLSKATAMSLPAVLLVLSIYPLRELGGGSGWWSASARHAYRRLAPFALLSATSVLLSIVALHPPRQLGIGAKVGVSAYSLSFYLLKTIVPVRLSPLYQMPQQVDALAPVFLVSGVVVAALCALAWWGRRRWPGVSTAWVVFVVIALPMLGIVQNGPQIVADRYTYHAAPALALLVGALVFPPGRQVRRPLVAVAALVLACLSVLTWSQTTVWRNTESLWTQALAVDSTSSIAQSGMAGVLFRANRIPEATVYSERAVALAPGDPDAHDALGVALARQGKLAEAVAQYERVIVLKPTSDEAHENLGVVTAAQGDLDGAIGHYRRALELNPDNADAHVNWGNALVREGRPDDAIVHYEAALRIRPDHADAHHNWGVALARQGRLLEAIEQFRQALAIDPGHAEARAYLEKATQLLAQPSGKND